MKLDEMWWREGTRLRVLLEPRALPPANELFASVERLPHYMTTPGHGAVLLIFCDVRGTKRLVPTDYEAFCKRCQDNPPGDAAIFGVATKVEAMAILRASAPMVKRQEVRCCICRRYLTP